MLRIKNRWPNNSMAKRFFGILRSSRQRRAVRQTGGVAAAAD